MGLSDRLDRRATMDTFTSLGEDILYIPDEAPPRRKVWTIWRIIGLAGAAGIAALVVAVMAVGAVNFLRESRRQQCAEHLKRVGLAMHQYHDANDHFPAPALIGSNGTPLLSWRVALLPQMGYQSLYERFHRDEPWDSPHNRSLLSEMPAEFACPGGPARRQGRTGYLVVVGPPSDPTSVNTPFDPTRGVDRREITDGESNTVLVFETDTLVPWTKPDDLRWERNGPLPRLASPHTGGAHGLFADGSVRFLRSTTNLGLLLGLLTINGGEVLGGG
jgi:prepilin-type processing-associated H-X9-DG protein